MYYTCITHVLYIIHVLYMYYTCIIIIHHTITTVGGEGDGEGDGEQLNTTVMVDFTL